MLAYNATEPPWTIAYGGNPGDDYAVIASPYRERAICNLEPQDYTIENARLICAAPQLLQTAQKVLLWMDKMNNQDNIYLYNELRQVIEAAGGFSPETQK